MKSQRRHELQQNVLDAELGKALAWAKRHTVTLLGVLVGVLAIIIVSVLVWRSHKASSVKPQNDFFIMLAKKANPSVSQDELIAGFKLLADQTDDRRVAAYSCLEIASIAANKSLAAVTPQDRKENENVAIEYYKKIDQYADFPEAIAQARYGIGKLAEGNDDINTAKAEYEQALKLCPQGSPFRETIAEDLQRVTEYKGATRMLYSKNRPVATSLPSFQGIQ